MRIPEQVAIAVERVFNGSPAGAEETETLDFKSYAQSSTKDALAGLAEAAACLANDSGGYVVVGVRDKPGGPVAFEGTALSVTAVRGGIFERVSPGLLTTVGELHPACCPDVRLLVIAVEAGAEVYSVNGRVTQRIKTDCRALPPAEVHKLYSARLKVDYTAEPTDFKVSDVPAASMETLRRRLRAMGGPSREVAGLPDGELLGNLKLTNNRGYMTRAGTMLLIEGREDSSEPVVMYVHRANPTSEPDFSEPIYGSILEVSERCLDLISARRVERQVLLPTGQQISVADFPSTAVREAVANALIHRDARRHGSVHIDHNSETLTVTSPGGFVAGVSASNVLTCEPKARNPALAWAAREIRLGERLGVGVDRMYRSMIEAGGDPPTFVEIEGETAVRVRLNAAGNTEIARFVAQLPTDGDGEHEIDVLMVLHSICRKRTLDANDLAPLTQRTTTEAQTLLERMTRAPWLLIEPTRQTVNNRLPKYRLTNESLQQLGNAVHYHRRSADDIDRKVLAHVEEYGRVTNQTVRNWASPRWADGGYDA